MDYQQLVLHEPGQLVISPGAKQGMIPLAIPLTKNSSGSVTALLRWPTAPSGMEMPVVEICEYGVWLLAKNVDQFIHRLLVEEDVNNSQERSDDVFDASAEAGEEIYRKGDFSRSQVSDLDVYLLRKVGLFPDVIERKVANHFEKGDQVNTLQINFVICLLQMEQFIKLLVLILLNKTVSAMVTGEFYTRKEHFPGFARPFAFNAEILLKVGRKLEAKDAARGALKSPWWTLGCKYQDVAAIAEWDDEQIEYIKEKVTEEGRQVDLKKGKAPAQIALDEAAFLLDLASVEGTWDDSFEQIADCYREAGLYDIANFVGYRD